MKYQEFIENVKDYISSQLNNGQKVVINPVTKNNGIIYDGLFIVDPILNVSPTIYLSSYYQRYLSDVSMEDIYDDILNAYRTNLPKQDFDVSVFTDFSKAESRIVMKLINQKRNEALLQDVPHISYLDLAIVFVCSVTEFLHEYATILIHNQHLSLWDISQEKLYQIAMNNTPKLLPYEFESMEHILKEMTNQKFPWLDEIQMYVLTNRLKIHGACCLVYPGLLEMLSEKLDSDLVIIPSSIHEVLIIPERTTRNKYSFCEFEDMIHEVNDTQLSDDEILGDHAYLYKRDTGILQF